MQAADVNSVHDTSSSTSGLRDVQQDVRRFRMILAALQKHKGISKVFLDCILLNGNVVHLEFPKLTTSWNALLRDTLKSYNVKVHAKDVTPKSRGHKYRKNGQHA